MNKVSAYRETLRQQAGWDSYLLEHSGLPGPRGNLELLQAVVEEGDEACFRHLLTHDPAVAATNTPQEFLAACGAAGLGKLLASGQTGMLEDLQRLAADPRWRVREGVAMALQYYGDHHMPELLDAMDVWRHGNLLVQRAVVAALCEPRLLCVPDQASRVLSILNQITTSLATVNDRKTEDFRVLRQALGYGWSVAVVALPAEGQTLMEKWCHSADPDIRWIMRENLKKNRLTRLDKEWVAHWQNVV